MSTPLSKIEPLKWAGQCPYCSETAPLFRATFSEPWTPDLVEDICGRCADHLNENGIDIPHHPLNGPCPEQIQ